MQLASAIDRRVPDLPRRHGEATMATMMVVFEVHVAMAVRQAPGLHSRPHAPCAVTPAPGAW